MKLGSKITAGLAAVALIAGTAVPSQAAFGGSGEWERPNSILCNWWSFLC